MNALGQDFDFQGATGHTAQAGCEPQLIVVACATVKANDQTHVAQFVAHGIDVGQQVIGARLFAGFNQANNARVRCVLIFERLNGGNAGISRITIVSTTASIQLAVFVLGCPWTQIVSPPTELGLFVEVAVHQNGLTRAFRLRARGGHFKIQHGCAAWQANNFQ